MKSELLKRTVFGAIYVALVVGSMLLWRPYFFQLLFLVVTTLAVREFHRINRSDLLLTLSGMLLAWLMFASVSLLVCTAYLEAPVVLLGAYGLVLLLTLAAELFKKAADPIANWGILLAGQAMIALPFTLMNLLFDKSPMLLLALFVIIWLNDSGAYCVGSLLGRHKMFPRVSPGKSWEGLAGGAVFGMAAGYVFLSDPFGFSGLEFAWWQSLALGLTVVIAGTLGDLMESLTKRTLGIKDSGNVIPGHGGWLDRFDSILFATPALLLALLALRLI